MADDLDQLREQRRAQSAQRGAMLAPDPASSASAGQRLQQMLDVALPAVGGTVGGIAGARAAGRPGALAGAGVGSAAGSVAADATRTQLDPTITATPGEQVLESATNALGAGVAGVLGEGVLGAATRVSLPVRNALGRTLKYMLTPTNLEPEALIAQEVLEQGGSTLSAAQLVGEEGRLLNVLEGIGQSGFFSGAGKFHGAQDDALDSVAQQLIRALGPGTSLDDVAASKLFNVAFNDEFKDLLTLAGGAYGPVDQLAKATATTVDSTPFFKALAAGEKDRRIKKVVQSVFGGNPAELLATTGGEGTFATSFENARAAEISLRRYARTQLASKNANVQAQGRVADKLAGIVSGQVDSAASSLGPEARKQFDAANTLWATNIERFRNPLIVKLVDALQKEPGRLSKLLLTDGKADTIRAIKDAVTVKRFDETIKPPLMLSIAYRAADPTAIMLAPDQAIQRITGAKLLEQLKSLGPDLLNEITGHSAPSFEDFAKLGIALERASMRAEGPGGLAFTLRQPSAVGTLITAGAGAAVGGALGGRQGAIAGATLAVVSPPVLMKIMSNRRLVHALATGLDRGPSGAALIRRTLTRAVTQATLESKRVERNAKDRARKELAPSASDAKAKRKAANDASFPMTSPTPVLKQGGTTAYPDGKRTNNQASFPMTR